MQRKKMLDAARLLLKPRKLQGRCVQACAVDGGLVACLYKNGVDMAYIVTDGDVMHRMGRVCVDYGYGVMDEKAPLAWTKAHMAICYDWRGLADVETDRACRSATGMTWDELAAHLEAAEAAREYAANELRKKRAKAEDCAAIETALCLARYKVRPKGLDAWALEMMRARRLRHTRIATVRVTAGEVKRMAVLQYDACRQQGEVRLTLERIALTGPGMDMQLTQEGSYCSWPHPSGWAIDKSTAKMAKAYIYPTREVRGEFAGTRYAHLPLWTQCRHGDVPVDAYEYVRRFEACGAIVERMTRAGLYRAAVELRPVSTASDLRGALGLTKAEQRILTQMDGGARELDEMRTLERMRGRTEVSVRDVELARVCRLGQRAYSDRAGFDWLKTYERRKLLEYIVRQADGSDMTAAVMLRLMIDAKRMEMQLHLPGIDYPRDLKAWHDQLSRMQKIEDAAKYDAPIAGRAAALERLSSVVDGIVIRPIRSGRELAEEGAALNHCVASYAQSYADGRCAIFCARPQERAEESCVTVEVRGGKVEQARGHDNRIHTEDERRAKAAVDAWERDVLAKMAKKKQAAD